jgi:hypothetical protein
MGQPKKQSSPRKTGLRRSHLRLELARRVNAKSPVKVRTTTRETGKALAKKAVLVQPDDAPVKKSAKKPAATAA